jgi:hypothetical protein
MEDFAKEDYFDKVTRTCRAEIERILSPERIVSDLHSYLELDKDENVTISVVDENNIVRKVVVDRKDNVTVFAKRITFHDPRLLYFPLTVRIGIGNVEIEDNGYLVEKCIASLHYNHSLEMITADFDYNAMDIL